MVQNSSLAFLAGVGGLALSWHLYKFLHLIYDVSLAKGISLTRYGAGAGGWALVTGCTDGIGREFALQLGKANFNLLLVSRTKAKLDSLNEEIKSLYPSLKVITIELDFSDPSNPGYEVMREEIASHDITLLVNNVGIGDTRQYFFDLSEQYLRDIIEVNISANLRVTAMVVAKMLDHKKPSLIFNLGSGSAVNSPPRASVYSGTKAFLDIWSRAFGYEVERHGILIQNLVTYFVHTKMSPLQKKRFYVASPKEFVYYALRKVGVSCGIDEPYNACPHPGHAIYNWVISRYAPYRLRLMVGEQIYSCAE